MAKKHRHDQLRLRPGQDRQDVQVIWTKQEDPIPIFIAFKECDGRSHHLVSCHWTCVFYILVLGR